MRTNARILSWRNVYTVKYEACGAVTRSHLEARVCRALCYDRLIPGDLKKGRTNAAVLADLKRWFDDLHKDPTADYRPPFAPVVEDFKDYLDVMGWIRDAFAEQAGGWAGSREREIFAARIVDPPRSWEEIGRWYALSRTSIKKRYDRTLDRILVQANSTGPSPAQTQIENVRERNRAGMGSRGEDHDEVPEGIYVMKGADGRLKLGHSRQPQRRARELGRVEVLHETDVIEQAERIELLAHRVLALHGKHIKGEWFEATLEDAILAIEIATRQAEQDELALGGKLVPRVGMGRPPLAGKPMTQVAIRFPQDLLDAVDRIVAERYGQAERNSVIRELVAEAIAARESGARK